MTPTELRESALRLAAERTDGSTNALYLLVERMRPVIVALVDGYSRLEKEHDDLLERLEDVDADARFEDTRG